MNAQASTISPVTTLPSAIHRIELNNGKLENCLVGLRRIADAAGGSVPLGAEPQPKSPDGGPAMMLMHDRLHTSERLTSLIADEIKRLEQYLGVPDGGPARDR